MGFAQVGSESGWRAASSGSVKDATAEWGWSQESRIKAIRSSIEQEVGVIAFSPVVESGWEKVLGEAKAVGIPAVLTGRAVEVADTSLHTTFLGSDFVKEGRKAGDWLLDEYRQKEGAVSIVELRGTAGSAPATDRRVGFEEAIDDDPRFQVVASADGHFTRAQGRAAMRDLLPSEPDIDVLDAHNGDMALGAFQAIEEDGLEPGTDIKII